MATTKRLPWRTLQMGGGTGRFTREQLDQAVLAVKAEREARARGGKSNAVNAESSRKQARGSRTA